MDRASRRRTAGHRRTVRAPGLVELEALAAAARADGDETIRDLLRAVAYTGDTGLAEDVGEHLRILATEQLLDPDPFAPPPEADALAGELSVGVVDRCGLPFGLRLAELAQHVLIVGSSGGGKTTLMKGLLTGMSVLPPSFPVRPKWMVFDIKRDYAGLAEAVPGVLVLEPGTEGLRWNPLEPPIEPRRWAGILSSVFSDSMGFFVGSSTENFGYKCLLELYGRYGTAAGQYPCLLDLRDYLGWLKTHNKVDRHHEAMSWFLRSLNRVESLCSALGETVNCSRGYPLDVLLARNVVFDLAAVKPDAQAFFVECFLTQCLHHRIARGERGGTIRNVAVFDEGKRLFPRYREEKQTSISNMSNVVALSREFGIGLVVADCDPSLLANSIKASCYTRFCFNQTHGEDVKDSAAALGLDRDQAAEIQSLQVGEAIVRLGGRIGRPFVVRVDAT